jgi:hypothetical protein
MATSADVVENHVIELAQKPTVSQIIKEHGIKGALEYADSPEMEDQIKTAIGDFVIEAELPDSKVDDVGGDINEAKYTFTCAGCGCTVTCTPA